MLTLVLLIKMVLLLAVGVKGKSRSKRSKRRSTDSVLTDGDDVKINDFEDFRETYE